MLSKILSYILAWVFFILLCPILLFFALLIFLYDHHNPFYVAPRVGKNGRLFNMIKLRSMGVDAHKYKIDSTANDDPRIIPIGQWVRRFKIDEFGQLMNVIKGDMCLVGPRPQVPTEVNRYTKAEKHMLDVKPGITDISSIVFADEGDILDGASDPDLSYTQLIRPWKSRLALLYIKHQSLLLDVVLLFFTFTNIFARPWTLHRLAKMVMSWEDCDVPFGVISRRKNLSQNLGELI